MRNTFLLEELLLENRIEDVKKKYPNITGEVIEQMALFDPSGNNKYLDFIMYYYDRLIDGNLIIKFVKLFHKNVNKLNKELLDGVIEKHKMGWLLTDDSPVGRIFQSVYKSPKDINSYKEWSIFERVMLFADQSLPKSEVKKLEANILYNSDDILIMIPKSHKASCYYGAGTKWCTTNRDSDNYYNRYTSEGTLIYYINKKENQSNDWYKAAFFIKDSGECQVFDAPDTQKTVTDAYNNLQDKWEIIRDTIVEYLYKNNLKGIENFYRGQDLISWMESINLDPLKVLSTSELIKKIGKDDLTNYLKKRDINIFKYFNFPELLDLLMSKDVIKKIWDGYKNNGINPLTKMSYDDNPMSLVINSVYKDDISLDEFLHFSSDPEFLDSSNIFSILNKFYGSKSVYDWHSSKIGEKLLELFKNDIDLIFGYASSMNINLFQVIDVRGMNILLHKKFNFQTSFDDALTYTLENKKYLKDALINYGFPNTEVMEYLLTHKSYSITELIESKLIKDLKLEEFLGLYEEPKTAFKLWLENKYGKIVLAKLLSIDWNGIINDVLIDNKTKIKLFFPNLISFGETIKEMSGIESWDVFKNISTKNLYTSFFDRDFYSLYKYFFDNNKIYSLNTLILIKALDDDPIKEETGLKEMVLNLALKELKGDYYSGELIVKNNKNYIVFNDLRKVLTLFVDEGSELLHNVLFNEDVNLKHYHGDSSQAIASLDNEIINKIVKDILMNHFRGKKITMDLEWVDEFDSWVESIDDEEGVFSFTLYDEMIYEISDYKLEGLISNAPELSKVKYIIEKAYKESLDKVIVKDAKDYITSLMEDIFGNGFMNVKQVESTGKRKGKKNVYEFQYDHLEDDIIAYADEYIFYEDILPTSVISLMGYLADNRIGRFDGYISANLEGFVDDWYNFNSDYFNEEFSENLYKQSTQLNYD